MDLENLDLKTLLKLLGDALTQEDKDNIGILKTQICKVIGKTILELKDMRKRIKRMKPEV